MIKMLIFVLLIALVVSGAYFYFRDKVENEQYEKLVEYMQIGGVIGALVLTVIIFIVVSF